MTEEVEQAGPVLPEDSPTGAQTPPEVIISDLEVRLAEKDGALGEANRRIVELEANIRELDGKLSESTKEVGRAVSGYRTLVVKANPGLVAELVEGESIEAIDASVEKARNLIVRVRRGIEEEAARSRVPSGAPPRGTADFAALTPREKIQHGIGGK